jgi:hypothetical protein
MTYSRANEADELQVESPAGRRGVPHRRQHREGVGTIEARGMMSLR